MAKRDLDKKRLFIVVESTKKSQEIYNIYMSENEIKAYCKTKNEFYGYIEGIGGDKSYTCFAYYAQY